MKRHAGGMHVADAVEPDDFSGAVGLHQKYVAVGNEAVVKLLQLFKIS